MASTPVYTRMWTNVFKIGGLHQLTWFQFLPNESELNHFPEKSGKQEQKDAATHLVLSSHLQLQKEGFLSTWTNSFVGPWDPSQGVHNPDEKIKLWLFLAGRHSSVVESAQAAVSRLRVLASGLWLAPGDSEEIAAAISQALRNRIEKAMMGLSYMRFGDVFSKYQPFSQSEELLRRGQLVIEFVFAATEETLLVHVLISAKHVRALLSSDFENILNHSSKSSDRLPVIVSPHGMHGMVTGCCPSDLVKQVYLRSSKFKSSNGIIGLPNHFSQNSSCQLRGQSCYVEVTVGCTANGHGKALRPKNSKNLLFHCQNAESSVMTSGIQKGSPEEFSVCEKTFIYPVEAVLVPIVQASFARSSLKRFWLQNWVGPSLSSSALLMHGAGEADSLDLSWVTNQIRGEHDFKSSSNSNSSSISSTSSDSDHKMASGVGELEADADSLTCRHSGLSSNDNFPSDGSKLGCKRPRSQSGMHSPYKSNYGAVENDSGLTGVANDVGLHWDDDGRGVDIQALLSEFGDFGDFFGNDELSFGEPPGTAESQAVMYPAADSGDVGSGGPAIMEVADQMILPTGFSSFDNFSMSPVIDESICKNQEGCGKSITSSGAINSIPASSVVECVDLMRAEAMMTFASEYRAVEASTSEFSTTIVKSPYIPKSRIVESANSSTKSYVYGATPPSSPCVDASEERLGAVAGSKACSGKHDSSTTVHLKNYYNVVDSAKELHEKGSVACKNGNAKDEVTSLSSFSGLSSTDAVKSVEKKMDETCKPENMLLSTRTVLAKEDDCLMFQASMCSIRHTLLSYNSFPPMSLNRMAENTVLNQLHGEPSTMTDGVFSKYEVKKKETIPVRIAGDIDGGLLDGPLSAPVGVWRSVGAPKGSIPMVSQRMEMRSALPTHSPNEEGMLSYGQRQPLQEFLDGLALLVQQATSFVDVALDADCCDGPFGWLALQEQWRRGFACGPLMMHAGCGGSLASCHSLDIAGVELADPLLADVSASSVIGLMQSDIRTALRSTFRALDGPLSITDWCKGRSLSSDSGFMGDGFSVELTGGECRDSSGTPSLSLGDSLSPSQSSAVGSPCLKDGVRVDETGQQLSSSLRPTLFVMPLPALLVGYQDDWLKTSAASLHLWEKAPLEPYASQKPMTYYVVCPDIDPLTTAAADFFQQLGTVYETCKLGTHLPQVLGNQMEIDSGKLSSSGFVLLDCPQSMKIESSTGSLVGSISDYFLSLSNGWDLISYLKSLSKALKTLRLGSSFTSNPKEGNSRPCTVIYVVCPFPDPIAVIQTVVESSIAVGSVMLSSDKERKSITHNLVGKALSCSTAVDEASISNVLTLSGFSVPKLVLQIVTVDAIFRVTSPAISELVILKETAFTVYNKARKVSRGLSSDVANSAAMSSRSDSSLIQVSSPIQGMWKESIGPRTLQREGHIDPSLRSGGWDNSWHSIRGGGLSMDPQRNSEFLLQDEAHYMFEPLFILAEPGSLEQGVSPLSCGNTDDCSSGTVEAVKSSQTDRLDSDNQKSLPSLHCCYGWTEDWRWLVCIWTDSRGELLDSHIFPFGGISSRQDTKGLQSLFVQMLQQGCQILQVCSSDTAMAKSRDFVITRIGCFYELECQEWQKALYSVGGSEVKKWPLQLRRSAPDGMLASSNGPSLPDQEMNLIQERNLGPSPSPLYSSHSKTSGFVKGGIGQPSSRKQLMGGSPVIEQSRGLLQWAQSITFVSVSVDHSLHLVLQADLASPGASQGSSSTTLSGYIEGFTPVKSLGNVPASYVVIPSPSMRFLPPSPLQLPTCLTAESPPLAHLLHSKGSAVPLCTGFIVSKAVPSMRKDSRSNAKEEWPSVLKVGLVDYYGGSNIMKEKMGRGVGKHDGRDFEIETHLILKSVVPEFHALSWMTVSPAYLERRTALPFHCDMVLRVERLLHFADKELSRRSEKT